MEAKRPRSVVILLKVGGREDKPSPRLECPVEFSQQLEKVGFSEVFERLEGNDRVEGAGSIEAEEVEMAESEVCVPSIAGGGGVYGGAVAVGADDARGSLSEQGRSVARAASEISNGRVHGDLGGRKLVAA